MLANLTTSWQSTGVRHQLHPSMNNNTPAREQGGLAYPGCNGWEQLDVIPVAVFRDAQTDGRQELRMRVSPRTKGHIQHSHIDSLQLPINPQPDFLQIPWSQPTSMEACWNLRELAKNAGARAPSFENLLLTLAEQDGACWHPGSREAETGR